MVKSILIDDYVHSMLTEKQRELLKKDIKLSLSDIAAKAIEAGIDSVEE